jgi:3-methylfumaryl-CoA hydratase
MPDTGPQMQTLSDPLDPARARALEATLGMDPALIAGQPLPPFFHRVYFWEPQPPDALGRDGHPKTGDLIPDIGDARRMWAAGRVQFHRPLLAGIQAERRSAVAGITRKTGRSGPLTFLRLRHDIWQRAALCLSEWQDIVYRTGPAATAPEPAPADPSDAQSFACDPTMLFRYSALTFNGHRIHYDAPYARDIEGYAGLVVHGPLLAQLLMLLAENRLGRRLSDFSYRATAPLIAGETGSLCWQDGRAWVRGPDGRLCMTATAD